MFVITEFVITKFDCNYFYFSALDDESLQGVVPSMGRITGSASIETLVRVGIEKENGLGPESKMVVLHDFTPCVDDELEVKRGQIVHVLYQVRPFCRSSIFYYRVF